MEFISQLYIQFGHFILRIKELSIFAWISAFIIGLYSHYLILIGCPNPVINFIFFLVIFDFVTRFLAQLVKASEVYQTKTKSTIIYFFGLLFFAYREKYLSSRKFFYGVFVKIIAYTFLLGVAEFSTKNSQIILISFVPNLVYGSLVIYDVKSNLENLSEIGFNQAGIFIGIFNRKIKEMENGKVK